jgi:cupin 2 domain-containing protein
MTRFTSGNLFAELPQDRMEEQTTELLATPAVKIERIVSHGQASPEGFWYDQDRAEWVILLTGSAKLLFEGEASARTLRPGDYVDIPAHTRHRVEWTDTAHATIWLAVHHH